MNFGEEIVLLGFIVGKGFSDGFFYKKKHLRAAGDTPGRRGRFIFKSKVGQIFDINTFALICIPFATRRKQYSHIIVLNFEGNDQFPFAPSTS